MQHELLRSAKYRLIDAQGRIVREIEAGPALHTFRVPMVDLQSGIYFFQLWEEAKMLGQVKVLKQ